MIYKDKEENRSGNGGWEDTIWTEQISRSSSLISLRWAIKSTSVRPFPFPLSSLISRYAVIAHSRGSIFSSYFLSTRPHSIPYFVDVSGRFKMNNLSNERTAQYDRDFEAKGYSVWKVRVAGQEIIRNVTLADVRSSRSRCEFRLTVCD